MSGRGNEEDVEVDRGVISGWSGISFFTLSGEYVSISKAPPPSRSSLRGSMPNFRNGEDRVHSSRNLSGEMNSDMTPSLSGVERKALSIIGETFREEPTEDLPESAFMVVGSSIASVLM